MNILVIAPHADDEILGVGGTIARYIAQGDQVYVCITAKGFKPFFSKELVGIVKKEALEAHRFLGIKKTFFLNFPAAMLERVNRSELNHKLQQVIDEVTLCMEKYFGNGSVMED
jgi:LmbE family N-acetylglucosaminyl deacetylase